MSTGTIEQVDPSTLTIALNVRTDVKLDKGFVASIKELGILQPPMVTRNADGQLEVVLGQRRTLAAVEAGLKEIPVYVVDQSEAEAARVVDQLTENDQRQGLSEAERVAGYKQLALFGVTPAQIAKKTSTDRKRVDTALAVADNETASAALTEYQLTLDEAAVLLEFSDDAEAVKALVKAAGNGDLAHVANMERKKRDLRMLQERLQDELVAEKVVVMLPCDSAYKGPQDGDPEGLVRLDKLGSSKDSNVPLDVKDVPKKALAGRVVTDYMNTTDGGYGRTAVKQYFVLNPEAHGIPELTYSRGHVVLTEEAKAEQAAREERDRAAAELRVARQGAAEVRWAFVSEFIQRKTLPDDALQFVARVTVIANPHHSESTFELLGVELDEQTPAAPELVDGLLAKRPQDALRIILASVLVSAESEVNPTASWRLPSLEIALVYLAQLEVWGYGLSAYEKDLLEHAAAEADGGEDEGEGGADYSDYDDEGDVE